MTANNSTLLNLIATILAAEGAKTTPKGREMGPEVDAKVAAWLSRAVTDELNMFPGIIDEIEVFGNAPHNQDYIGLHDRLIIVAEALNRIGYSRFGTPVMNQFIQKNREERGYEEPTPTVGDLDDLMRQLFSR